MEFMDSRWRSEKNKALGPILLGTLDLSVRDDQWKLAVDVDGDWYGITEAGSLVAFPTLKLDDDQLEKLFKTGELTIVDNDLECRLELTPKG